jgi:hypothetical protein
MTEEMQNSVLNMISRVLHIAERRGCMSSKRLGTIIGTLNFLKAKFPRASLYLRSTHSALTAGVKSVGWTGSFMLSSTIISELLFWYRNVSRNEPYGFVPRVPMATLTTDSGEPGWGADLRIGRLRFEKSGFFSIDNSYSLSNQRETAAVLRGLINLKEILKQAGVKAMTIRSDNAATVCNLQRQGAGLTLLYMTKEIFKLL